MRKIALLILMSLLPVMLPAAETSAFKMLVQMEKLWKDGHYVEAMDSALRVLVVYPGNQPAQNFIHDHWDTMVRHSSATIEQNSSTEDIDQSVTRLEVYRQMASLSDNMREVQLPLRGNNWVWYPELYYSQGDYDTERMRVYRLLLNAANESLREYDAEAAKAYFLKAVHYLLPDTEKETNMDRITAMLMQKLQKMTRTRRIPDAIFAYELCSTTLALDSTLDTLRTLQPRLKERVAELYRQRADELLEQGDTTKANDYRAYAVDWMAGSEEDIKK